MAGLVSICVGTYGLLDSTAPRSLGLPMLLGGLAVGVGRGRAERSSGVAQPLPA